MGGYQHYGPLLCPLNTRCRMILRTQKGIRIFENHPYPSTSVWVCGLGILNHSETFGPFGSMAAGRLQGLLLKEAFGGI